MPSSYVISNYVCIFRKGTELVYNSDYLVSVHNIGDEDAHGTMIGQLESFQPGTDDWEQYSERLEQFITANSITDADKK